ncbi:hypothetical protein [Desulfolucanica intricata]|uniref:hypothetical protein n=1 Tax=Desulfolucanica intricata TaxID=1285191 RepID=UPI00082EF8F9|nr:hypothetical protein [Desulfolucanica intricata]
MAGIEVGKFVQEHQEEIKKLVDIALNRAGDKISAEIAAGRIKPTYEEALPVLLYEVLTTHTISTLRLVADMLEAQEKAN